MSNNPINSLLLPNDPQANRYSVSSIQQDKLASIDMQTTPPNQFQSMNGPSNQQYQLKSPRKNNANSINVPSYVGEQDEEQDDYEIQQYQMQDDQFISNSVLITNQPSSQHQMQQNKNNRLKRQNVFSKQQEDTFTDMMDELQVLMEKFDLKVVEALGKREYELLKCFQVTMEKMTLDLQKTHQKLSEFNREAEIDIKIVCLEKQLNFFRGNCEELNRVKIDLTKENTNIKNSMSMLEQELLFSKKAHLKTQHKILQMQEKQQPNEKPIFPTEVRLIKQKVNENNENMNNNANTNDDNNNNNNNRGLSSRKYRYKDQLIIASQVIQLKDNIQSITSFIDQVLISKIDGRDKLISQQKQQLQEKNQIIKNLQLQLKTGNPPEITYINNSLNSTMQDIFLEAISDVQHCIVTRQQQQLMQNSNNSHFPINNASKMSVQLTKQDRIQVITTLFTSKPFLEAVKAMITSQRCCYNQDCKFNIVPNEDLVNLGLSHKQQNKEQEQAQEQASFLRSKDRLSNVKKYIPSKRPSTTANHSKQNDFSNYNSVRTIHESCFESEGKQFATKANTLNNSLNNSCGSNAQIHAKKWSDVESKQWGKIPLSFTVNSVKQSTDSKQNSDNDYLYGSVNVSVNASSSKPIRRQSLSSREKQNRKAHNRSCSKTINEGEINNQYSDISSSIGKNKIINDNSQYNNASISKHITGIVNSFIDTHEISDKTEGSNQKIQKSIFKNNKLF